jgi:septal ring factor EnvC (AmiA/AmiB activator)
MNRHLGHMKNFLQNLLIFFALCLCAVMIIQWVIETDLRKNVQKLNDQLHEKAEAVQSLTLNVKRDDEEIKRLDGLNKDLTATVKSNKLEMVSMAKEIDTSTREANRQKQQSEVYKEALDKANENIITQNENIKRQNDEMKKLADERNEVVKKFNKTAQDLNDLVAKWNAQQEELAKAATNNPPKK